MEQFSITVGADGTAFIGAPAHPFSSEVSDAIRRVVLAAGVKEAHLLQCYIANGVDPSAQVLVVVLETGSDAAQMARSLNERLHAILPAGEQLLIWPMHGDSESLAEVRGAGCQLVASPTPRAPWWRFWS